MRHSNSGKKLGRTPSHRKALFRNMASAMITYGKIRTTEVKAKELRRVVEPLITLALRITKMALPRKGDCAPMAILEFTRQPEAAAEKN